MLKKYKNILAVIGMDIGIIYIISQLYMKFVDLIIYDLLTSFYAIPPSTETFATVSTDFPVIFLTLTFTVLTIYIANTLFGKVVKREIIGEKFLKGREQQGLIIIINILMAFAIFICFGFINENGLLGIYGEHLYYNNILKESIVTAIITGINILLTIITGPSICILINVYLRKLLTKKGAYIKLD